jgi:hypothetical protein
MRTFNSIPSSLTTIKAVAWAEAGRSMAHSLYAALSLHGIVTSPAALFSSTGIHHGNQHTLPTGCNHAKANAWLRGK